MRLGIVLIALRQASERPCRDTFRVEREYTSFDWLTKNKQENNNRDSLLLDLEKEGTTLIIVHLKMICIILLSMFLVILPAREQCGKLERKGSQARVNHTKYPNSQCKKVKYCGWAAEPTVEPLSYKYGMGQPLHLVPTTQDMMVPFYLLQVVEALILYEVCRTHLLFSTYPIYKE